MKKLARDSNRLSVFMKSDAAQTLSANLLAESEQLALRDTLFNDLRNNPLEFVQQEPVPEAVRIKFPKWHARSTTKWRKRTEPMTFASPAHSRP